MKTVKVGLTGITIKETVGNLLISDRAGNTIYIERADKKDFLMALRGFCIERLSDDELADLQKRGAE